MIVVGLTSAGKSSLLERIIGHPIFPVRDNVCTRRPFKVRLKNESGIGDQTLLKFTNRGSDKEYSLPAQIDDVRSVIEKEQDDGSDKVEFSEREIQAQIRSSSPNTLLFTDLPGIFLISERKMGGNYKESRAENEKLKKHTMQITKKYLGQKNTIVLLVISATDWMHGMNNDNLVGYLAEWLEEIRKDHDVPVYGVITKLDTQEQGLSSNSPIKKVLMGTLGQEHILEGLGVRKWIPVVSSPAVLNAGTAAQSAQIEVDEITKCLTQGSSGVSAETLQAMPMGRSALLKELKQALLREIGRTHANLRKRMDQFVFDLDKRLQILPQPATPAEKRRIFDSRLKTMETVLTDLIGAGGKHLHAVPGERSLRMRLLVDSPKQFEQNMKDQTLRGDIAQEVQLILNQAALEQGGSFDSDVSFNSLSVKIIERYTEPCLQLVQACADIVRLALRQAVAKSFGDYKELEALVLRNLGMDATGQPLEEPENPQPQFLFSFLRNAARFKVLNLLDAFQTMACFHPMWRNFDILYEKILAPAEEPPKEKSGGWLGSNGKSDDRSEAEIALQDILDLPALAKVVREEGENAIRMYESESKTRLNLATRSKIKKHFARVEVMGYIVRMSLIGSIFPLVLRDMRDGLFRGVKFGNSSWDHSVCTHLRMKLVFDSDMEKRVFAWMEPSVQDLNMRTQLEKKKATLVSLGKQFDSCQVKLDRLNAVLRA